MRGMADGATPAMEKRWKKKRRRLSLLLNERKNGRTNRMDRRMDDGS
jgi:hypothetical protein